LIRSDVVKVTPSTNASSVQDKSVFEFDSTFYINTQYIGEGLYGCGINAR
jgi:hypothetical protein